MSEEAARCLPGSSGQHNATKSWVLPISLTYVESVHSGTHNLWVISKRLRPRGGRSYRREKINQKCKKGEKVEICWVRLLIWLPTSGDLNQTQTAWIFSIWNRAFYLGRFGLVLHSIFGRPNLYPNVDSRMLNLDMYFEIKIFALFSSVRTRRSTERTPRRTFHFKIHFRAFEQPSCQ